MSVVLSSQWTAESSFACLISTLLCSASIAVWCVQRERLLSSNTQSSQVYSGDENLFSLAEAVIACVARNCFFRPHERMLNLAELAMCCFHYLQRAALELFSTGLSLTELFKYVITTWNIH